MIHSQIENVSYSIKGFGSLTCSANPTVIGHRTVTYTLRRSNAMGQRVWDGACECGATSVRMEYAKNARKGRR